MTDLTLTAEALHEIGLGVAVIAVILSVRALLDRVFPK